MTLMDPTTIRPKQQPPLPLSSSGEENHFLDIAIVSGRRLLLTDLKHKSVLLVDSQEGGVLSTVSVPCVPFGVCMVHAACAAVALPHAMRVQYVYVNGDTLTLGKGEPVGGKVWGLSLLGNMLVVTYMEPPAVEVVTQEGKRLRRFDNISADMELLGKPWYVAVSGDRVFVSDWSTNIITMLSDQLQLLATFSHPDLLHFPQGIISLNNDQLLVCGRLSDNIVLLQPSNGQMSAFLERKDGMYKPVALAFCHHSKIIYSTPLSKTNSIKRFMLCMSDGIETTTRL